MSSDAGKIRDRASEVRNEDMIAGPQRISVDTRSTAWDAILNEIGGMKEAWSEDNDKIELTDSAHRSYCTAREHQPGILAGLTAPPDRFTILQSLPSREAADRQVPFFSANLHYSLAMLTVTSQRLLRCPSQKNLPTTVQSTLGKSIQDQHNLSYNRSPDDAPHEYQENGPELAELYRLQTAQCLVIADITKPTEFMIETLDLHSFAEYDTEQDGDIGTAMLSGIMMRLALQQGFHRDPSQLPGLSIFQGEMRRRIWSAVNQHELLWSVQIGLPKAIRYSESDTQAPRILYEEELYEEMTELPPCRPLTTDTEVCYQVFKWQLMRCYGRVVEFVHIIEPQPYEEVLKLDLMLLEVHEAIPFHLQFGTLEQMKNDPNSRIMEKFILKSFWHKSVCILHRKYWDTAPSDTPQNSRWVYSRKASLGSALSMLEMQYTMHQACAPGGLMIPECVMPPEQKLDAIRRSRAIWQSIANDCRDAKRAVKVLTAVLDKLSKKYTYLTQVTSAPASASLGNMSQTASPNFMPGGFAPGNNQILGKGYQHVDSQGYNTYFTDCVGVGMSSSPEGFSNSNLSNPNGDSLMQDNFLDAFSTDLTIPSDFDWNGWDQFLAGQSLQLNQDLAGRFGAQMGNGGMDFM
ncbi:uncharacterized protein RSE6_00963 [Rhynchosporium secalis]|uniref:Xylanolytic transcriptional activator regulatory domain-containing protein n=1 Tax=Rhynchosporium secalis TaxID=38038 RepID=A0A1E1LWJ7_RHYSE|nr:uncharacterized protein RSE6_00963 [Rhynchosporium secalis]